MVNFVHFHNRLPVKARLGEALLGTGGLPPVAQFQERVVLASEFAREEVRALALGEALDDEDDVGAAAAGFLEDRASVDVEDAAAGPATKVLDGGLVAVVDMDAFGLTAARANGPAPGPAPLQKPPVTAIVVKKVIDREGKEHGREAPASGIGNVLPGSDFTRRNSIKKNLHHLLAGMSQLDYIDP